MTHANVMQAQETAYQNKQHKSEAAIIYFFRPKKFAGSIPEIIVASARPDKLIVKIRNGSWFRTEYAHFGKRSFVTGVYSINPKSFDYVIEPGKTYYIRCTLHLSAMKIMSRLELVNESVARYAMTKLQRQDSIR